MENANAGPALDATGVLAWKLLEYLSNKRPSAQAKLGTKRLDDARDLAEKYEALISPSDMRIARDKLRQCVLSLQCVSSRV